MLRVGLILVAFIVAICTPWLIVGSDLNSRIHPLPGGWNVRLQHSLVVVHSQANHLWMFSLKDLFVIAAILVLIGLIFAAAIRQRRHDAPGFEIQRSHDQAGHPQREA